MIQYLKSKRFEMLAFSLKKETKNLNGDSILISTKTIENSDYCRCLAVVCDGVSKSYSDSISSQLVIATINEEFNSINFEASEAILNANMKLNSNDHKLLSTCCLAFISEDNLKINIFNVGDSRAYLFKYKGKGFDYHQITVDDSTSEPFKINGKIQIQAGSPIFTTPLTRAIGDGNCSDIIKHELSLDIKNFIVLLSDGAYNQTKIFDLISDILINAISLEEESQKKFNDQHLNFSDDDTSIILIRRVYESQINIDINEIIQLPPYLRYSALLEIIESQNIEIEIFITALKQLDLIENISKSVLNKIVRLCQQLINTTDNEQLKKDINRLSVNFYQKAIMLK